MNFEPVKIISPTSYDRQLPKRKLPHNNTDVWIGRFPNIPYLRVCWDSYARFQVLRHAYRTPHLEVGGVLIGEVYRSAPPADRQAFDKDYWGDADFPIDFIQINYSLPAQQPNLESGKFTFTQEAWADINRTLDHMNRDGSLLNLKIVGWYHTHPGHGLALGGHDLFIHNNYFSNEFQLALLIETTQHAGAFFVDSAKNKGPFPSEKFIWDSRFLSAQDSPILPASYAAKTTDVNNEISIEIIENHDDAPATLDKYALKQEPNVDSTEHVIQNKGLTVKNSGESDAREDVILPSGGVS